MLQELDIINQIIARRRTVKPENYSPQPVAKEVIEQLLENARWAPTHGMNEPWQFVVFTGDARQQLANFLDKWYVANTLPDKFNDHKYRLLKTRPSMASCVIAICMKRKPDTKIPEIEDIAAVACAVQNIHLTATAYGLVGYWSTPAVTYTDEVKIFLGLAENDRCLGFFYIGYPAQEVKKGNRTPIEEKVVWAV